MPTDRLPIMRDPRIGAIGATGLFVSLILRYSALVSLPEPLKSALFVPAIGRWAMVVGAYGAHMREPKEAWHAPFLAHLSAWHVSAPRCLSSLMVWSFGFAAALTILLIGGIASRLVTMCCRYFWRNHRRHPRGNKRGH